MNQDRKEASEATRVELEKPKADDEIQERFERFHAANPRFYYLLVFYIREVVKAREARGRGRRYGIAAVVERVRWHVDVEAKGVEEFKMPNDFRSRYARLIMQQEPDLRDVFELRELRAVTGREDRKEENENGS